MKFFRRKETKDILREDVIKWLTEKVPQDTTGDPIVDMLSQYGVTPQMLMRFDRLACKHCGGVHVRGCGRIKAISYHSSGEVASVKYRATWDDSDTIYRDDITEQ